MCGRFAFFSPREAVQALFGVTASAEFEPRYNIAPTQNVWVIRLNESGSAAADQLHWGLVPFWAKDPAIGNRMINARAETITEKPSYRMPVRKQRCLILADGFYEWQKTSAGKTPMFIRARGAQVFGMAGIWDTWSKREGAPLQSCSIITVPANDQMAPIHHRMPVLMDADDMREWLNPGCSPADVSAKLLRPQVCELECWPVSKAVNSPLNDKPELITQAEQSV